MKQVVFIVLSLCMVSCKKETTIEEKPQKEPTVVKQVDDAAQAFLTKYNVPAVAVAVIKSDKLIYAKTYGIADKSASTPANNESLFRIASISKPITGVAIMKLVEEGKLKLDDKVFGSGGILGTQYGTNTYVNDITVRHLLQHTAGGWGNEKNDPMFLDPALNFTQLITWTIKNIPLTQVPGTKYAYSNFGYCLLGRIVEKITGKTYETWVKEHILEPSGIKNMSIGGNTLAQRKTNEVVYYGQGNENPYVYNLTRMDAHGGWLASATDLARFLVRVNGVSIKPDILSSSSIAAMTTGSSANPNYGFGWSVNGKTWWHTGSLPGTGATLVKNWSDFSWVVICNTRSQAADFSQGIDDVIAKAMNDPTTVWPTLDLF